MVIERLGRFHRVARSGPEHSRFRSSKSPARSTFAISNRDVGGIKRVTAGHTTRIDLREQVLNFPSQPVITKDNVTIDIDAVIYYRVADPQKATYSVQNLPYALETLTRTTLRNIVGEMELDATLGSRDVINTRMREVIEEASIGWGVDVTRVELQAIEPPRDIQQSMELQMRAERERRAAVTNAEAGKRAAILEAEGVRESQVRRAEGEKDAAILRAQGLAEARLAMAKAEAEAITKIASALPEGQAAMYLLGMKYLEALPTLAQGKNATIFLPAEAAGVMGAIGGLRELVIEGRLVVAAHAVRCTCAAWPTLRRRQRSERSAVVSSKPITQERAERIARVTPVRELRRVQLQEAEGEAGVREQSQGAGRSLARHEDLRRVQHAPGNRHRRRGRHRLRDLIRRALDPRRPGRFPRVLPENRPQYLVGIVRPNNGIETLGKRQWPARSPGTACSCTERIRAALCA